MVTGISREGLLQDVDRTSEALFSQLPEDFTFVNPETPDLHAIEGNKRILENLPARIRTGLRLLPAVWGALQGVPCTVIARDFLGRSDLRGHTKKSAAAHFGSRSLRSAASVLGLSQLLDWYSRERKTGRAVASLDQPMKAAGAGTLGDSIEGPDEARPSASQAIETLLDFGYGIDELRSALDAVVKNRASPEVE